MSLLQGERDFDKRANGVNSELENALVGDLDPAHQLKQERPHHRRMIELAMQGYLHSEIALATGFSPVTVANTLKQPWARAYLIKETKKTVSEQIKQLLEEEAIPALKVLKEVAHNPTARTSDRLTASNALLDRFLGKPVQPISNDQTPPSEMTDEELRKQIERELTTSQPN